MKYEKINLFLDTSGKFSHATVETNFGSVSILDELKFNNLLEDYAKQEGITADELIASGKYVQIFKVKGHEKEEPKKTSLWDEELEEETAKEETKEEIEEEDLDDIVYNVNRKRAKKAVANKKIIKRLVAFAAAGVVLVTGAVHLKKHTNLFNGKPITFTEPFNGKQPIFYDEQDDVIYQSEADFLKQFETLENNNKPQYTGNITIVDSEKDNAGEYDKVMEDVIDNQEKNENLSEKLANKEKVQVTSEQILYTLEDNSRIASSSMFEVSEFINNKDLRGKAYYYNFENMFAGMDYTAVKVFSDLRNIVLRSTFEEKDLETTKTWIRQFYAMYTDFVYAHKNCLVSVNGKESNIIFDELSDMAKATILDLGVAMFTVNLDYNYANGEAVVSKFEILDDTIATLDGEIVPSLLNKGRSK